MKLLRKPSPKVLRRTLTTMAICLALGGIGLVTYPFATDMWAARLQGNLIHDFTAPQAAARFQSGRIAEGDPLTRLEIPSLDVDTIVVEGTSLSALRAGAGHYPETSLPGDKGNVAIAGHRTTYGRPFNQLDELTSGDRIILTTPVGRHVYEVMGRPFVVDPTDYSAVVDEFPTKGAFLTLTSCHPEGSAAYRIVVRAELVESTDAVAEAVNR